jgi:hypothetical protein
MEIVSSQKAKQPLTIRKDNPFRQLLQACALALASA